MYIGLIHTNDLTRQSGSNRVQLECFICGSTFSLAPISGVAANEHFIFLGGVCNRCLDLDQAALRATLRRNATQRRAWADKAAKEPDELWRVERLHAEADEREHYAAGEIVIPPELTQVRARKTAVAWTALPLLHGSTAVWYQGWFGSAEAQKPADAAER